MFKKIFNDFCVRLSAKTINISEDDFKKMTKDIRNVVGKYGVTISVFSTTEEFVEYVNRENRLKSRFLKIYSFANEIKERLLSYKKSW